GVEVIPCHPKIEERIKRKDTLVPHAELVDTRVSELKCRLVKRDDLGGISLLDRVSNVEGAKLILAQAHTSRCIQAERRARNIPCFALGQFAVCADARLGELLLTRKDAHLIVVPK